MRVYWLDNAKALSIFFVVLGHFLGLSLALKSFIYAFHLPLFLLISGFLVGNKLRKLNLNDLFKYQLFGLIKLYLLFSILSIFIFYFKSLIEGLNVNILNVIYGTIYGTHGKTKALLHGNGALWYFPFFITSLLCLYVVFKLPRYLRESCIIALVLVSLFYTGERFPWSTDNIGIGVFFLYIGAQLNNHKDKVILIVSSRLSLYILPIAIGLLFILSSLNGVVNINKMYYGEYPLLFFINALIGCWIILTLSYLLGESKKLSLISAQTLFIFCVHLYFVKSLRVVSIIDNSAIKIMIMLIVAFLITFFLSKIGSAVMPSINRYIGIK